MSFSDDIKKFTNKAERAALYVFRGTALDIFSKIILRTPVDSGRLRGNWQASLNTGAAGILENTSIPGVVPTVNAAKITDTIFMVNNLPYAERIEDGYSSQAPTGMVKTTVAEFQAIVSAKARQQK